MKGVAWKKTVITVFVALAVFFLMIPVMTYAYFANDLGDRDYIMNNKDSGLTLLDRQGQPFFTFYEAKTEEFVPLDQIPSHTKQAVIAAEDKNFYENPGFSIRGIARAFLVNLRSGEIRQGGSTISQELIKNELLTSEVSYYRKYQEIVLAYELNRRYNKDEILEMYLNSVYFGEGAFGVENAAQTYFGKSVDKLNLSESALLTGLLPAPSSYSPLSNDPSIAKEKQELVLDNMVENGAISQEEADKAKESKLTYSSSPRQLNQLAPHFAIMVKDQLINEYGEEFVVRSGMEVKTTLNRQWQAYAQEAVRDHVATLNGRKATNGAAVAIDPDNGEILVMVGSVNWFNDEFGKVNMATTPRQAGSAFKPIIYSWAIDKGIVTPATILMDRKTTFQRDYTPRNYDNRFRGPVTVRRALANSLNVPAVQVMEKVGVQGGLEAARELGIRSLGNDTAQYGLSMVLGAGEVTLVELTNAYATFANQGVRHEPTAVIEIRDKFGEIIDKKEDSSERAISSGAAFLISSILSDRNARAETFGSSLNLNRSAAVKTGTTQEYRGALTAGYTPSLSVGVWVGNNDNTPMVNLPGSQGAAPLWRDLMQTFLHGQSDEGFMVPDDVERVTICRTVTTRVDGDNDKENDEDGGNGDDNQEENDTKIQTRTISFSEYVIKGTMQSQNCSTPPPQPQQPEELDQNNQPTPPPQPEVQVNPDLPVNIPPGLRGRED